MVLMFWTSLCYPQDGGDALEHSISLIDNIYSFIYPISNLNFIKGENPSLSINDTLSIFFR